MNYCKDLKKGDLILVAYGNTMLPAIFLEIGLRQNPRFYIVSPYKLDSLKKYGKIYKDYITRNPINAIAKISEEQLSDSIRLQYEEFSNLLMKHGYL